MKPHGTEEQGAANLVRVAVIYYSATGNVHRLADAVADGAREAGAVVRMRKVRELAPREAIERNSQWLAHAEATRGVPEATLDDLEWADAVIFGTPTRYGTMSSQLKQFIDTTGPLWQRGALADKVYSAFVSAGTKHGGHESTLLALGHVFQHWGGIIVPPGYTDAIQFETGTPYGTTHLGSAGLPDATTLAAARYQARRAVTVAAALRAGRERIATAA